MDEAEKERRRALAIRKLAKVLGRGAAGGAGAAGGRGREECSVLREVLRLTDQREVAELVQRRLYAVDPDLEDLEDGPGALGGRTFAPAAGAAGGVRRRLRAVATREAPIPVQFTERGYWDSLLTDFGRGPGSVAGSVGGSDPGRWGRKPPGSHEPPPSPGQPYLEKARRAFAVDGYCTFPMTNGAGGDAMRSWEDHGICVADMARAVDALAEEGLPPVFLFAFDWPWQMISHMSRMAASLMDCPEEEVVLEASFFAWSLGGTAETPPSTNLGAVGQNFGLPHQDYPHNEATAAGGEPQVLSCWIPLVDTTPDNGCLYILPRGADELWAEPAHPLHMRPATRADGRGLSAGACARTEVNFPLAAAVPQLVRAGEPVVWAGNTVHWGAACHPDATSPQEHRLRPAEGPGGGGAAGVPEAAGRRGGVRAGVAAVPGAQALGPAGSDPGGPHQAHLPLPHAVLAVVRGGPAGGAVRGLRTEFFFDLMCSSYTTEDCRAVRPTPARDLHPYPSTYL